MLLLLAAALALLALAECLFHYRLPTYGECHAFLP